MIGYELAKIAGDGNREPIGLYPDRDAAIERARTLGPGRYAGMADFGPEWDDCSEESIEVRADGRVVYSEVGADGRIYEGTC
jgi:hypothetical protein